MHSRIVSPIFTDIGDTTSPEPSSWMNRCTWQMT
jgi:hypothetical protein